MFSSGPQQKLNAKNEKSPSTIHSRGIFVLEFKHKVSEEVMEKFLASVLMVILASFCTLGFVTPVAVATSEEAATSEETPAEETKTEQNVNLEIATELDFGELSERGSSYTSSFKVINHGLEDVKIELGFEKSHHLHLADEYKLGADWLAIVGGQTKQTIPANGEKDIRVRVTIPADAKAGTQYATIKITAGDLSYMVDTHMTILGDDVKASGELKQSKIAAFGFTKRINAEATVENTGNVGYKVKNVIQYKKGLSGAADWIVVVDEERQVVPNVSLTVNADTAEDVGYGIFTVEQKITYLNQDGEMVEETRHQAVINCPAWLFVAVIGVIVAVIVIAVILKHKKEVREA